VKPILFLAAGIALFARWCAGDTASSVNSPDLQLNNQAVAYAEELISCGDFVSDAHGKWSEHRASVAAENEFIRQHGFQEYAKWYLAIDTQFSEGTKRRYKFPIGDFKNIHRCALLAAEQRASQFDYSAIKQTVARLRDMIEKKNDSPPG
jgi:hypothetical protein